MSEQTKHRVVLAGGSGFLGTALAAHLLGLGYDVLVLTRAHPPPADAGAGGVRWAHWDGRTVGDWARHLDGARAVVNLAGRSVNCRYTAANLAEIDGSRVDSVRAVGRAIAGCPRPPAVLVQAGTLAIYGDAGERPCDEAAPPGAGIPPRTAVRWEQAFNETPTPGTRRVLLRISFALGRDGGALATLAGLARWFLGGAAGSGAQYVSWVHLTDLCRIVAWAIEHEGATGVYNATSPGPVTNAQFMRELRRVLGRPWSPPTPAWLVRLGCVLMRTEPVLALTGRRGVPARLEREGFVFDHPTLPEALRDLLG